MSGRTVLDITKTHWNIQPNEKRPGRNAKQNRGAESSAFLTSNKKEEGGIYFSPRKWSGRTKDPVWLLELKESLGDLSFWRVQ